MFILMKIDLLNSEGGIVIVSIVDDEIILSFHGTKETQKYLKMICCIFYTAINR